MDLSATQRAKIDSLLRSTGRAAKRSCAPCCRSSARNPIRCAPEVRGVLTPAQQRDFGRRDGAAARAAISARRSRRPAIAGPPPEGFGPPDGGPPPGEGEGPPPPPPH
jgi:hypothetical protein